MRGDMSFSDAETKQVIFVFTEDDDLIGQLSNILNEREDSQKEYVLVRQAEVAELGSTATASVLDLALVGENDEHNAERVVSCINQIKGHSSRYPLFLLGDDDDLSALMQVQSIRHSVKRRLVTPLKPEQVISALSVLDDVDAVRLSESEPMSEVSQSLPPRAGSQKALSVFTLMAILALAIAGYWYLNQRSVDEVFEEELVSNTSSEVTDTVTSTILGSRAGDENSSTNDGLFNADALVYLDQARQALKKGYVIGPEGVNALHFYRLALSIDPYNTLAQDRQSAVMLELKSELTLAVEQGKVGRSNSILRIITELDPFNAELESLRQTLRAAFVDGGS